MGGGRSEGQFHNTCNSSMIRVWRRTVALAPFGIRCAGVVFAVAFAAMIARSDTRAHCCHSVLAVWVSISASATGSFRELASGRMRHPRRRANRARRNFSEPLVIALV